MTLQILLERGVFRRPQPLLRLHLQHLPLPGQQQANQKYQRASAQFTGTLQTAEPDPSHTLTQTFEFDGVRYELVLDDQAQLRV